MRAGYVVSMMPLSLCLMLKPEVSKAGNRKGNKDEQEQDASHKNKLA